MVRALTVTGGPINGEPPHHLAHHRAVTLRVRPSRLQGHNWTTLLVSPRPERKAVAGRRD